MSRAVSRDRGRYRGLSQWNISVLFRGQVCPLCAQCPQRLQHGYSGGGWFDDAIQFATLGRQERGCHVVRVFVCESGADRRDILTGLFGSFDFATEKNIDRALPTHDGDLGGGPREVNISPQLLG